MDTKQIIEASATVVTITKVTAGSVYKRVEPDYQGIARLKFGVVTDVMHNGSEGAFTALEYNPDHFAGVVVEQRVYDGGKPHALYLATPEEVRQHLAELRQATDSKVERAEEELRKAVEARDRVTAIQRQADAGILATPSHVIGELVSADA